MKKKSNNIYLVDGFLALAALLAVDFLVNKTPDYLALVVLVLSIVFAGLSSSSLNKYHFLLTNNIENNLRGSMSEALKEGNTGILLYNEEYEITYMSSNLVKDESKVGEKLLVWLPELQDLLVGNVERTLVIINDDKYLVTKKDDSYVLFFKDISREYDLSKELKDNSYVLGIVNFDNYDDSSLSEDQVSYINTNIKVPVIDYFKSYGIVYKTLRNNRLQLILNKQMYQNLLDDRFSILKKVRKEAKAGGLDITLSISFAMGGNSLAELDELATSLIELAATRGGDQVAVREVGKEVVYFGGTSEAKERKSQIRVRVVASTLSKMMADAKNIIIVGHKDADADCIGAGLMVSILARSMNKDAYIITKTGGVDPMIKDVMTKYETSLNARHNFISESEGLSLLDDKSLVVMVDHHSKAVSTSTNLLEKAKNIVIIDHHRRKADLDVNVSFIYIEPGASSATELLVELSSYLNKNVDITSEEANILYIGLLIDTNHFKNRSDGRTFEVAKKLKDFGADQALCERLIAEPFEMVKKRYYIISLGKRYKDNIMIADVRDGIYPRSIASQAVDMMIEIKEIDAAFVLCSISKDEITISARSNENVNVQMIMEKLGGGGHMTAAGIQVKDGNQDELYTKLIAAIDEYLESEKEDESNTIE